MIKVHFHFYTRQTNNFTGLFATLRKKIDAVPNSRCVIPSECIRLMTPGSRNVFFDVSYAFKSNYTKIVFIFN
jgi:ATP-dependent DNA ligase